MSTLVDESVAVPVNVLLVDDQPANLLALEAILRAPGLNLVRASSGEEALRRLLHDEFAVLLLDVQMVGLDGFETARLVRSRERSRDTPIIFLTAYESPAFTAAWAYTLGAVDYLVKPLVPEILRTKVAVFVELYRKAERIRLLERAAGERRLIDERQGWELERLRGEASRRDEFLAMLAHELRNPLAPVLTGLNLLGRDDTDEHARKQVREMVGRQLRHLTRLVDDLVDVARLIRGRVTLRPERLDLTRLVRTVVGDRRSTMEKSGLALQLEVPENPVWLDGDPSRLTQVLDNLLDNAARFTEPGGRVMVRLGTDADGRQAILSVRDTGAGIDPALLGRLFDAFAQAEEGPDRSRGGLGLGLTVVKGLVELHGGTVEAKSGGPGCGAEFTVRLQAGAAAPAATEKSEINGAVAGSSQLRVLIVEDNRDGADILRTLLELQGYHARVAYSGPEGIETATTWQPDIVLCDLGLPGIDGYGVARNLRHNSATAKTRLVAVSGYGAAEDRRRSREAGFDVHLLKPVDSDELLRVLAAPVSNRETA